jgi:hypothetical protein
MQNTAFALKIPLNFFFSRLIKQQRKQLSLSDSERHPTLLWTLNIQIPLKSVLTITG